MLYIITKERIMMDILISNNRNVTVDSFTMDFTYAGLLSYTSTERINKAIFEGANYPSSWGNRKVLKIEPNGGDFKIDLNHCYYCAWMNSDTVGFSDADGSTLVVIWFGDLPNARSIENIIQQGISKIDWEANAENFNY
jgi:hypothetical protein